MLNLITWVSKKNAINVLSPSHELESKFQRTVESSNLVVDESDEFIVCPSHKRECRFQEAMTWVSKKVVNLSSVQVPNHLDFKRTAESNNLGNEKKVENSPSDLVASQNLDFRRTVESNNLGIEEGGEVFLCPSRKPES